MKNTYRANKRALTCEKIRGYIREQGLRPGSKLPSQPGDVRAVRRIPPVHPRRRGHFGQGGHALHPSPLRAICGRLAL